MCNTYSESGKPCGVQRCEEYEALKQECDALRQEARTLQAQLAMSESAEVATAVKLEFVTAERDSLLKVRESADKLAEAADVIRRIHIGDGRSGIKVAIEAYKEARDGRHD